jgi:5-methylcytosine-specific restriction enzyme A
MTGRKEFSKKVKLAAWQRSGGICECGCGVKIITGDGPEYDHVTEDTIGGEPTLENCMVMRKRCHDAKTRTRRPEIDKTRRGFEKRIKARSPSRPMPGSKASGLKHKMNGDWVKR